MTSKQYVVIVPGLGDQVTQLTILTRHFRHHGMEPVVYNIGWNDRTGDFAPKLTKFLEYIDALADGGAAVSLIGCSAGGSAVLNAFIERKQVVRNVVNVCGILRPSKETGTRSFAARTRRCRPFGQSVIRFSEREKELTRGDRKRIMTVYPAFCDELVAPDSAVLPDAVNIRIPFAEHVLSIAAALTIFSRPLIRFLKTDVA